MLTHHKIMSGLYDVVPIKAFRLNTCLKGQGQTGSGGLSVDINALTADPDVISL